MAEIEQLVARYRDVITRDMGYAVRTVDESTLAFEVSGLNMLLFCEERDPEYLHLVAMFPPPEQEIEAGELAQLCNQVTKEAKVAKVVLDEDGDLIVSAEMIVAGTDLMPTPEQVAAVLPRAISAVFNAVNKISMALELLGISRAVYDGEEPAEEAGSGKDGPKRSPAKWDQHWPGPPADEPEEEH